MEVDKTIVAQKVTVASGDGAHFLAGLTGPLTGRRIELPATGAVLGRATEATIQVKDPAVSSRHCRLGTILGQVMVQDLGSSNGTFIDEEQVVEPRTFPIGSVLQIGNSLFKLEFRSKQEVLEEERQARELEKAAGYVRALLPQPLNDPPVTTEWRFIPSDQLGGDAFGYHFLPDGRFALYLVDVRGVSAALAAAAFGVPHLAGIVCSPLAGLLSDRLGRRAVILIGVVALGPAWLSITLLPTELLPLSLVAIGIASSLRLTVTEVFVTESAPPHRRATYLGGYYMLSQELGGLAAPLLGLLAGGVGIGAAFVMYVFIKVVKGKLTEVHPLLWAVAIAFVIYFMQDWIRPYVA